VTEYELRAVLRVIREALYSAHTPGRERQALERARAHLGTQLDQRRRERWAKRKAAVALKEVGRG